MCLFTWFGSVFLSSLKKGCVRYNSSLRSLIYTTVVGLMYVIGSSKWDPKARGKWIKLWLLNFFPRALMDKCSHMILCAVLHWKNQLLKHNRFIFINTCILLFSKHVGLQNPLWCAQKYLVKKTIIYKKSFYVCIK